MWEGMWIMLFARRICTLWKIYPSRCLSVILLVSLSLSFPFWPCPRHAGVSRPAIKPMAQQWQHWILNPLSHQGTPITLFLCCQLAFIDGQERTQSLKGPWDTHTHTHTHTLKYTRYSISWALVLRAGTATYNPKHPLLWPTLLRPQGHLSLS